MGQSNWTHAYPNARSSVERAVDMFLNFGDAIGGIAPPRADGGMHSRVRGAGAGAAGAVQAMPPAPLASGGVVLSCGASRALVE